MTERLFGTDGVRGLANDVITPALAMELAQAASIVLGFDTVEEGVRPRAVIANDSRSSADFIVSAMKAGFASAGVDVLDAGICLLYTSPSPRDMRRSRMPSSA